MKQKQAGRAFEYAVYKAIVQCLQGCQIECANQSAVDLAGSDFDLLSEAEREDHLRACLPAIKSLFDFEPHLHYARQSACPVKLDLLPDCAGAHGDVRDVVLSLPHRLWEMGISAKHNHEALKHSRLSTQIDFGEKWLGEPCSQDYFESIAVIFARLDKFAARKALWSEIADKEGEIYLPLLKAFAAEIISLGKKNPAIAGRLVQYLVGTTDFYKIIKQENRTKVQVFNFKGTLNQNCGRDLPRNKLDKLKLPNRIVEVDFKSDGTRASTNTLLLIADAGWQITFRLHNASSKVERSLKFDIKLEGLPSNLHSYSLLRELVLN